MKKNNNIYKYIYKKLAIVCKDKVGRLKAVHIQFKISLKIKNKNNKD